MNGNGAKRKIDPSKEEHDKSALRVSGRRSLRFHEYLEVVEKNSGDQVIVCVKCGNQFASPRKNYKDFSIYRKTI